MHSTHIRASDLACPAVSKTVTAICSRWQWNRRRVTFPHVSHLFRSIMHLTFLTLEGLGQYITTPLALDFHIVRCILETDVAHFHCTPMASEARVYEPGLDYVEDTILRFLFTDVTPLDAVVSHSHLRKLA
jgi:hypothetical protein